MAKNTQIQHAKQPRILYFNSKKNFQTSAKKTPYYNDSKCFDLTENQPKKGGKR